MRAIALAISLALAATSAQAAEITVMHPDGSETTTTTPNAVTWTFIGYVPPCDPKHPPLGGCDASRTVPGVWLHYQILSGFASKAACLAYVAGIVAAGGSGGCI